MATTLEGAIVERFEASDDLRRACGSLTFGKIPDFSKPPASESADHRYVVFLEHDPVVRRRTTGSPKEKESGFRFLCHAEDHGTCREMRQSLEDAFDYDAQSPREPIEWDRGRTISVFAGNEGMDPNEFVDATGAKVVIHFFDLTFGYELY